MNDDLNPAPVSPRGNAGATSTPVSSTLVPPTASALLPGAVPARGFWPALALLSALSIASLVLAWKAEQRGSSLEQELVRRQQESTGNATEARALARQAQETAGDTSAKVALLEARVAEVAVQRGQLEDLVQSLSRSRDDNVLVDIEAALRLATQQTSITGNAELLVATLKQSDERLARYGQPRLEGVRRAITRDVDRVRAVSVADIGTLGIKLDEAIRLVDELTLVSVPEAGNDPARGASTTVVASGNGDPGARAAVAPPAASAGWAGTFIDRWNAFGETVWNEAKSLVRVTRIDHPEAMLLAPEQSFFVRENLKLRLLNARLALLSRQFDTAQADLQAAQTALERYFERGAKRTVLATELVRQVAGQARHVAVPRPDDTLAALAAAAAGR